LPLVLVEVVVVVLVVLVVLAVELLVVETPGVVEVVPGGVDGATVVVMVVLDPPHAAMPAPAPVPSAIVATAVAKRFMAFLRLSCTRPRSLPKPDPGGVP
jgi:hypothetical protein